jgi:hypothetical protein
MTNIAELGIRITTDGAAKAKADLDAVAASGAQAEASAGGIGKAWHDAAAGVSASSATISKSAKAVTASFTSMPGDPFARERAGLAALGNQVRAEAIARTEGAAAIKTYQAALAQSSLTGAESLAAESAINVARDRGVISANAAA